MVFSHLPLSFPQTSDVISTTFDPLRSISEREKVFTLNEQTHSFPFFIPFLQEKDQVLAELYRAEICNIEGVPCQKFNFSEIPSAKFNFKYAKRRIQEIVNFLQKSRQLETTFLCDEKNTRQLDIPLNLYHFLKNLVDSSHHPRVSYNQDGNSQGALPPIPIQDIQLIGSRALRELKEILLNTAQQFFGSRIAMNKIIEWFEMEHVKRSFSKEIHDCDLRILSAGSLDDQAYQSNMSLKYFATCITNFDRSFYVQQLKAKHPKYKILEKENKPVSLIREWSVLEFGGIAKRKLVDLPKTRYATLALKIQHEHPFDLLYVGLKAGKPTLENLNLSSSNCWTVSIYRLIVERDKSKWELKIGCQPFTATKALIDLLCGISTIHNPNVDAWIRFVRDGERSMQNDIEHQMVQHVFDSKYRAEFLIKKQLEPALVSSGEYICHLLEGEIKKNFTNSQTNRVDSYQTISLLFRASLSLQTCASFSDEECTKLWQLAEKKGWFYFEDSSKNQEKSFSVFLKKGLIEEQVPFSVLSSWIGILAWIWKPLTATSHCHRPVFQLKRPLGCLLPIGPIEHGIILQNYFKKNCFPISFHSLYQIMASSPENLTVGQDHPLLPYFNQLKIDPSSLKRLADNWLIDKFSILNTLGLQLYFEIASLFPDKCNLTIIFRSLPELLQEMSHFQDVRETLQAVKKLYSTYSYSSGHQKALQQIEEQKKISLNRTEWISILIQTQDHELQILAYMLWKEDVDRSRQFARKNIQIGWSLFQALCAIQPRMALSLLQTLPRFTKTTHDLAKTLYLVRSYQRVNPRQFVCDLDQILPLFYSLFERDQSLELKNEIQQKNFSKVLIFLIETLYQEPFKETLGDYFLLEACRNHYLIDLDRQTEIWLERLEKLISEPEKIGFAYALYQVLTQEKFLNQIPSTIQRLQKLKIDLGLTLLKKKRESFSLALLDQLSNEDIESSSTQTFYDWALHLFQHHASQPLENFPLQLLDILLLATPPDHRFETQIEFYQFFKSLVLTLKSGTFNPSPQLSVFDKFLVKQDLMPIINQADEEWKEILLDYLETSSPFHANERLPNLWIIYERIVHLFNKTKNSTHIMRLCRNLSKLIEYALPTSHSPTPFLLEWIKSKHETILDRFHKKNDSHEVKILLHALNHYRIAHRSLASYLWWICQKELMKPTNSSILELLDLESFENFSIQIQPSHYACLPKLISTILSANPSRPSQAWQWIEWCLNFSDREKVFEHSPLMDSCLICAAQFIREEKFTSALHLLTRLSTLSPTQLEMASSQWIQIASKLSSRSSPEICRQLFLNKEVPLICQNAANQLSPLIPKLIHRLLSISDPVQSRSSEKILSLELLKQYEIKEAKLWLNLWESIDSGHDVELIPQLWLNFKTRADSLIGTNVEIAHCWTQAFACLQKTNSGELLIYLEKSEWPDIFSDPLTSHLKWKAVEYVFLLAVNTLSPIAFDSVFYESLLEKKLEIANSLLLEQKEKNEASSELKFKDKFDQNIELALIARLQSFSDLVCLNAVCRLLHNSIAKYLKDSDNMGIYLSYFEKVISRALKNSPKENHSSFQSLSILIGQTIEMICNPDAIFHTSCVPLVAALLTKHSAEPDNAHIKMASRLISKIFKQGRIKEIEAVKAPFLALMSHLFESIDSEDLPIIEEYIKTSFDLMGLSAAEKGTLSHQFIRASYQHQINHNVLIRHLVENSHSGSAKALEWNEHKLANNNNTGHLEVGLSEVCIKKMVTIYVKWSPYLFIENTFLSEAIEKCLVFIFPYANPEIPEQLNQDTFSRYLTQILDVKYQVKPPTSPLYKENLQNYHALVIHKIRKLNPDPYILVKALQAYIDKMIDQVVSRKVEINTFFHFFEEFIHLYPPQPMILSEEEKMEFLQKFKLSPHLTALNDLLRKALNEGLFKSHLNQLATFQIWTNCCVINLKLTPKYHLPILEKAIQKFLDDDIPYCISRAIQCCRMIQNLKHPNDFKDLIPFFKKILVAIKPHISCALQHDEFFYGSLLGYLDNQTRQRLPVNTPPSRRFVYEVSELFFRFIFSALKEILDDPNAGEFQAHYLVICMDLVRAQATHGAFENNYSSYFAILKEILPILRVVEIEHIYYNPESKLAIPTPGGLVKVGGFIKEWVNLLYGVIPKAKIQANEKQQQGKLFFESLRILQTPGKNDNLTQYYESLLTALASSLELIPFFDIDAEHDFVQLFESIKQTMLSCEDKTKIVPLKRLAFRQVDLEFYRRGEKSYLDYLKKIYEAVQLIPHVDFFQDKFPFSQFFLSLANVILVANKGDKENYFLQRQELFLHFLKTMQPIIFELIPHQLLADTQDVFLEIIADGVDQNLLRCDSSAATEVFEWAKHFLHSASNDRSFLKLLNLIFYQPSRSVREEECLICILEIRSLIPDLSKYIMKQKNFNFSEISNRFVNFLISLPITNLFKFKILSEWTETLLKEATHEYKQTMIEHIQDLMNTAKTKGIFADLTLLRYRTVDSFPETK